jgi:AcrR family transcriptional regulator
MVDTPPSAITRTRAYHHGYLPTALVDVALDLIAQQGVHAFSVAEAARRIGVSISAPYRHFTDRDELLAAVGVRALDELRERIDTAMASQTAPAEQLAAASGAYVRFAAERKAMFEVLFSAGLDKSRFPDLRAAGSRAAEGLFEVVRKLASGRPERQVVLLQAWGALAQGHATMLNDGSFGPPPGAVELAAERAAAATRALVAGRRHLFAATNAHGSLTDGPPG